MMDAEPYMAADQRAAALSSRFESDAGVSSSAGIGRLQFHFSTACALSDCVVVVQSRFSRL